MSASAKGSRVGDWMQTYTGQKFWPLDPREDEVDIRDIAHALAAQCRYAGHCLNFFSVAEHSVLLADDLAPYGWYVQLWALLHDASEAYLVDMIRPVKKDMPQYLTFEKRLMTVICSRFGLADVMPPVVHEWDSRILADEKAQNMAPLDWDHEPGPALGVTLQFWSPARAEQKFLAKFDELMVFAPEAWRRA